MEKDLHEQLRGIKSNRRTDMVMLRTWFAIYWSASRLATMPDAAVVQAWDLFLEEVVPAELALRDCFKRYLTSYTCRNAAIVTHAACHMWRVGSTR